MNNEKLSDAIGRLDDGMIEETLQRRSVQPRRWRGWLAMVACLCVLAGSLLTLPSVNRKQGDGDIAISDGDGSQTGNGPTDNGSTTYTTKATTTKSPTTQGSCSGVPLKDAKILGLASYPVMASRPAEYEPDAYDAWWNAVKAQRDQLKGHTDGMAAFYSRTMATFLAGEAGENRVYSPLNVYIALSMLAETANGNSRQQILDLLGPQNMDTLREKNQAMWNGVYLNDGAVISRLANSLWLAEGDRWQYDNAAVERLAKNYYTSTYKGVMGSDTYNRLLQGWLNDQTDGLLKEQAGNLKFDPETVLALASTVCFRAKWTDCFHPDANTEGVFRTVSGEVPCTFMNQSNQGFAYFGDRFTAISMGIDDGAYQMQIFLPKEGVAADALAGDSQVMDMLQNFDRSANSKYIRINMSIPKFDVSSDRDLQEGLKALGITDVFSPDKGDFTGLLSAQTEPMYITQVQHAARVAIDEEGVTAAAYTAEILNGAGAPQEVLDFVVDRPFMFAITGPGDTILFTGIVEIPA